MRAFQIAALGALHALGAAAGVTPAGSARTGGDAVAWTRLCGQEGDRGAGAAVCFTGSVGASAVTAAVIEPQGGGAGKAVLRLAVPGPLQLKYGARLGIDDEPPLQTRFFTCYASRCVADREATPELMARLKAGATLRIEAVGLSGAALRFALPLTQPGNNFRAAAEAAPATDAGLFDERQKQLLAYARLPGASAAEPVSVYSPWEKFCGKEHDADAGEVCFTGRDARAGDGRELVAVALIESAGDPEPLFRVNLPGPLRLDDGVRLTIDHDQPLPAPFSTCYADACMADYTATPQLIARLKAGAAIAVAATDLDGRTVGFTVPLSDPPAASFGAAYDGPAVDPDAFAQQRRKLQEDLQRRADEMRRSLEAAPATTRK